ncbi:MAG TPA: GNAT family N-acetyltransferase [Pyrinomonadaceae bacterium]|jgi:GNAT superfamily N-acetyltransferase|nr:GNAT family N-acetyltransferase [Pyrinomonadaceae bacterium]
MTKIRIADSADDEKIRDVINAAFKIAEEFFVDGNRITLEEVRRHRGSGAFLVAESDEAIDGCVYVEPRGERAYLGLLSVDPARQQGGLGSRLMEAGEAYCRERGARFMDIYIVNLRTELPVFYERRGYVENGTTPFPADVPTKQPCHFINMTKAL